MKNEKIILGIETSCDDTSMAIIRGELGISTNGPNNQTLLAHHSFSQVMLLEKWGGVVPELAARNHSEKLLPLLEHCLKSANLKIEDIDLIGVTCFPGLLGPLLTGLQFAKSISLITKAPILPINHLHAHLEAIHLTENIEYPYLGLLISGGHTAFFKVNDAQSFELIGTTIDDAIGEAFDKGGKLLGLGYPAGAIIDKLAKEGHQERFQFPIGLKEKKEPTFSYSGVKTALKVFIEKEANNLKLGDFNSQDLKDVAASYQNALVQALTLKTPLALEKAKGNLPIVIGGGVACNSHLREKFTEIYGEKVNFVKPAFCTDNGAMIAHLTRLLGQNAIPYPSCLSIDARSSYLQKTGINK